MNIRIHRKADMVNFIKMWGKITVKFPLLDTQPPMWTLLFYLNFPLSPFINTGVHNRGCPLQWTHFSVHVYVRGKSNEKVAWWP